MTSQITECVPSGPTTLIQPRAISSMIRGERRVIEPEPSKLRRHIRTEQAQFLKSVDNRGRILVTVLERTGHRDDFLFDELANLLDERMLNYVVCIHGSRDLRVGARGEVFA